MPCHAAILRASLNGYSASVVRRMGAALLDGRFSGAAENYPRGLPPWTYNNQAMTKLELQRVLLPSWQIVCHVNDIPHSGDYQKFDLGPESVVVLRDKAGAIRAYHNVCANC